MRRYKARNFEEVYRNISSYGFICPVTTILNYAWHFERDRYDWSLKICSASLDDILRRHYNLVGSEIFQDKRRMEWSDVEIVEKLVEEVNAIHVLLFVMGAQGE
jgi:hypothetical protein